VRGFGLRVVVLFLLGIEIVSFLACSPKPENYILLCAGDSLTEQGYPVYLRRLLKKEGLRVRVYNKGRSGYNSAEYLAYLRAHAYELRNFQPDFILLQLGTNDVRTDGDRTSREEFKANMKEIINLLTQFQTRRGQSPRLLLGLVPPIKEEANYPFSEESAQRVETEINPALLSLASELNLPVVNNWEIFMKRPELLPGIHPNPEGYQEMARAWLQALLPYFHLRNR